MTDTALLGPWLRRFLLEHLVNERNLSRNTRLSYRDTLVLLIGFLTRKLHHSPEKLTILDVSPDLVQAFLLDLEESRHCSIPTRNQRLAAIRSLARFVGMYSPEHIVWCGQMRCLPMKRTTRRLLPYLEKPEMEALLEAPDAQTVQGRRDRALLWFLYNSGTRADEAAQLTIADLQLAPPPQKGQSWVTVMGKECHSYCIFLRPRHETTRKHTGQQACDLAFSLAAVLRVVRRGIGLGPYTDAHGAGRVGPMSEPYLA